MTITYIRWRDACSVEADVPATEAVPALAELCEVGFLLAEDDEAVLIGMECAADDTAPGRWRLNIPKSGIVERHDMPVSSIKRRKRAGKPNAT